MDFTDPSPSHAGEAAAIRSVNVLSRGLRVIRAFVPRNEWRSNQELATVCALPKATVSRLVVTLSEMGVLECSVATGMYRLGPAALTLGYAGFMAASPWQQARAEMGRFADAYGAVVVVALREQLSMVCVEARQSELGVLSFRITTGSRLALPFSAVGRAYYGTCDEDERQAIREAAIATFPARKAELEIGLADALQQMRHKGFYVSISTLQQGINGLGAVVPSTGSTGARYTVGCAAPMNNFPGKDLAKVVWPKFQSVVAAVETCLKLSNVPER